LYLTHTSLNAVVEERCKNLSLHHMWINRKKRLPKEDADCAKLTSLMLTQYGCLEKAFIYIYSKCSCSKKT